MGPGLIAGIAGNDAGGITTYCGDGRHRRASRCSGCSRSRSSSWPSSRRWPPGSASSPGQGLSDLIRDRFGVRWTRVRHGRAAGRQRRQHRRRILGGAAAALDIFGIPQWLDGARSWRSAIWALVLFASYRTGRAGVPAGDARVPRLHLRRRSSPTRTGARSVHAIVTPTFILDAGALLLLVAVVGTTITPYMQFYLQSAPWPRRASARRSCARAGRRRGRARCGPT